MTYSKQWLSLSPEEKKIKRKEYNNRYEQKHPERAKEHRKRYEEKHIDQIRKRASAWQKEKGRKNKLKAIEYLGGHCADCKNEFPPYVYDFHHLDPTIKDSNIARIMGRKWENIVSELDKCILLCANCHRIRENKDDF
jgi:NAD-dependent dihydropyrimidine dehydrogenase PreA subunit